MWEDGRFFAVSFRALDAGTEWLAKPRGGPSPTPKNITETAASRLKFQARTGSATPVEAPSLIIELESPAAVTYRFQVFPEARGILVQTIEPAAKRASVPSGESSKSAAPSGIETAKSAAPATALRADTMEALTLAAEHIRLTQVTLLDQTDAHNQLVFENEWLPQRNEKPLQLEGNLFVAEDTMTQAGLVFLKLAPLPHARPVKDAWDFEAGIRGRNLQCMLVGNGLDEAGGAGYPEVVLAYQGGRAGRTEALQTLQRQLRPYVPARDGMFLSNTWGDRSRDLRINTAFMRHEIEAGSRLGVDVIQIDDGWQTGRTANSARGPGVWTGYWAENPNFWQPDPVRFPGGLQPLVKEAASKGLKFGLWFGPDSSSSFANWQRDADRLLELHRRDGIDYFKIDGVKAVTKEGERNLRRMFDRVQQETNGAVVFDLDVTAETRPGYFGMSDVGPLFVENRYTDFHGYWPHQTLRNLWQLAAYVDPLRLRMEVLNNERNQPLYAGDPLAPAIYSADYLFATVMFANPLGWFETSNLSPRYSAAMAKLAATWKRHRSELFADTILPIGRVPDGTTWSGFAAFDRTRTAGYVLLFRGIGAPAEWKEPLAVFGNGSCGVTVLGGGGAIALNTGELSARIPEAPGYVWVRVTGKI